MKCHNCAGTGQVLVCIRCGKRLEPGADLHVQRGKHPAITHGPFCEACVPLGELLAESTVGKIEVPGT